MSTAWRQYFSYRTVNRTGTFAPALSQPSGQEFLRLDLGTVVSGKWVMVPAPQRESRGLSPSALRAARGRRRSPKRGAPPDGRCGTDMGPGTDVEKQTGWGSAGSSSTELQSWGITEPARSVRFRQGTGIDFRYGKTGSATPVFRRTQTRGAPLSGTHLWDRVILV